MEVRWDGGFSFENVAAGSYVVRGEAKDYAVGKAGVRYASLTSPLLVEGDVSNLAYSVTAVKQ